MKTIISEKELNDYIQYQRIMRTSPCGKCQERTCCCGCSEEKEWESRLSPYEYISRLGNKCKTVEKYAKLILDIAEAKHKSDEWANKVYELESQKGRLSLLIETNGDEIIIRES